MAVDANLIKKADLVRAREVEFVNLFGENIKKLVEALGVQEKFQSRPVIHLNLIRQPEHLRTAQ